MNVERYLIGVVGNTHLVETACAVCQNGLGSSSPMFLGVSKKISLKHTIWSQINVKNHFDIFDIDFSWSF